MKNNNEDIVKFLSGITYIEASVFSDSLNQWWFFIKDDAGLDKYFRVSQDSKTMEFIFPLILSGSNRLLYNYHISEDFILLTSILSMETNKETQAEFALIDINSGEMIDYRIVNIINGLIPMIDDSFFRSSRSSLKIYNYYIKTIKEFDFYDNYQEDKLGSYPINCWEKIVFRKKKLIHKAFIS